MSQGSDLPDMNVVETGTQFQSQRATGIKDPGKGVHYWVMTNAFSVADPEAAMSGETLYMDAENLLMVAGPICFKCEEPYSKRLAHRKCTGSMDV